MDKKMRKSWLFLRGDWDHRTQKSIDDDDDMWIQLFAEMLEENDSGNIYFRGSSRSAIEYDKRCDITTGWFRGGLLGKKVKQIVFVRGGFPWQSDIMKKFPNAYKI
ncbi:unnamed protein product, partial [marine sediment metagenome]